MTWFTKNNTDWKTQKATKFYDKNNTSWFSNIVALWDSLVVNWDSNNAVWDGRGSSKWYNKDNSSWYKNNE